MADSAPLLRALRTPFDAVKTAPQDIDFAIDPSFGLTRRRFGWYSNNTLFDGTLVSNVTGAIEVATSATGTDTARLRSAYAGQYVSQTLAVPGQGMHVTSGVSESGGQYSLDNGIVATGAGWHDGSSGGWGVGGPVQTFLGLKWDTEGLEAICISNGSHVAGSPVAQSDFNIDPFDGSGPTGNVLDPSKGYVFNQPYTWYNEGALIVGVVDPQDDTFWPMHRFEGVDGSPSLDRPNMPTIVIVDNDGTAATTSVEVGGMQYTRYGSDKHKERQRQTPLSRITSGGYIATAVSTLNNAVNPTGGTVEPILAYQRTSGNRDLELQGANPTLRLDNDIYLFLFDEWDYASATGANSNLRTPHPVTDPKESGINVDSEVTGYTPTTWSFRGQTPVEGGNDNQAGLEQVNIESRVPIDATRVLAAVHRGTAADITAMRHNVIEGY